MTHNRKEGSHVCDIEAALTLSRAEVNTALGGLSPQKVHTSVLAEDAVRAALKNIASGRG